MKVDTNTTVCVSIAKKPGTSGLRFHNEAYELMDLNYVYLPLKILPDQLGTAVEMVRNNFKGCGVSMPHKEAIIPYLDWITDSAKTIGAVNTILNEAGKLKGYNTDYYGAKRVLEESLDISGREVLVLGAGGAAKAVAIAVKELGGNLTITNRTSHHAKNLANRLGANYLDWEERESQYSRFLVINATSIGFEDKEKTPLSIGTLHNYEAVMDVVVGDTKLTRNARSLNKIVILGKTMTVYQSAKQFEIYTGRQPPSEFVERLIKEN